MVNERQLSIIVCPGLFCMTYYCSREHPQWMMRRNEYLMQCIVNTVLPLCVFCLTGRYRYLRRQRKRGCGSTSPIFFVLARLKKRGTGGIVHDMKKRLVTSALPYVNNIPHLGNLLQVLSADCFSRFCRMKGYETLYVCGTDEYGTASETRALQEGLTPRELCDRYHAIHRDIYTWFEIDFDHFGRTSTQYQTDIVQDIFTKVDKAGYIFEKTIEQLYCEHDDRFLADRFVTGICPKCGASGARGDQCDSCQSLLDPSELIEPTCSVCGNTPVMKSTKHLYIDLPKALPLLQEWMDTASVEGFWAKNAIQVTKGWIRDGLKERAITRDLKWGIPVPKKGYENKVFYVWFDAPIGYISITAEYTDQWKHWWHNNDEVELFQFIGKDNIPFHTVIFPSSLLASGDPWTMLHHMSSSEYLNYEDGKFSKSLGVGIFGNDVQDTGIPADVWRFYLFYNRPEKADVTFTWKDFQEKVNKELIGNLSNLVNRTLSFVEKFYGGDLRAYTIDTALMDQIRDQEKIIDSAFERAELRDSLRELLILSSMGNKAFQDGEPWKMRKESPEQTGSLLKTLLILIRDIGYLSQPFMPQTSRRILSFLSAEQTTYEMLATDEGIGELKQIEHLFSRLEDERIEQLRNTYKGKQDTQMEQETVEQVSIAQDFANRVSLIAGKIVEIERHPKGEFLYIIQLDTGKEEHTQIVSSIVPYYSEQELLGRTIILVENLKPANFRSVKSRGMLLAASDRDAEPHTTCEVIFADDVAPGTAFLPEGSEAPEQRKQLKADVFFGFNLISEDGIVKIDGKPVAADGNALKVHTYVNGDIG